MGMYILSNEDKTEAVVVNDSVLPPQPLPFVFYAEDGEVVKEVNAFIDWYRPKDIRYAQNIEKEWTRFIQETDR